MLRLENLRLGSRPKFESFEIQIFGMIIPVADESIASSTRPRLESSSWEESLEESSLIPSLFSE